MRNITTNDRLAASHAFLTFWRCVSGQKRTSLRKIKQIINDAIDAGTNMDQIFNPVNYERVREKIQEPTPTEYLSSLRDGSIMAKELTREDNWIEENIFATIAESFHEFFIHIEPTGGVWSTGKAKSNLAKAITRFNLEAIMSETLIKEIAEKKDSKLTCFQYIQELIENAESYDIELSPTQATKQARMIQEETQNALGTIGKPNDDEDLVSPEIYEEENKFQGEEWKDLENIDTVMSLNPREWKRKAILEAMLGCSINELSDIASAIKDGINCNTLEDLLTALTEGDLDMEKENPAARHAHAMINGDISQAFVNCAGIQGISMEEATLQLHDPLIEDWDIRDKKARTALKLKQLIYTHGYEDEDLRDFLNSFYEEH